MAESKQSQRAPYVVVGGGIAGVTCAEELSAQCPDEKILLITSSALIKAVTNFTKISRALEEFDVEERPACSLEALCKNVSILQATVTGLDLADRTLGVHGGPAVRYGRLCLCTGGRPKVIAEGNPHVLGIRDTESVVAFQRRMTGARRAVIVGNGGIATELAYEIEGCQVVWAVKDDALCSPFVDAGAAQFFLSKLNRDKEPDEGPLKRHKYTVRKSTGGSSATTGGALGPDWSVGLTMRGRQEGSHNILVEYTCEVDGIFTPEELAASGRKPNPFRTTADSKAEEAEEEKDSWPVYISLTNGKLYGCDFLVSATGVVPNVEAVTAAGGLELASDGGLKVDDHMRAGAAAAGVYAAGDVCTAAWPPAPHWLQMRLWSQARQMGAYAARCMVADEAAQQNDGGNDSDPIPQDFCFELFAHVTRFFGHKVVLLGRYNGQGLGGEFDILLRMTEGREYVKVVLKEGRMQGAVLIGDTDLEETFENLILNQLDLSRYGEDLLDPGIDIEDYFD